MRKFLFLLIVAWLGLSHAVQAIPSQITYQGSLKQKNLPANGNYNIQFRVTNQDGTQVYWSGMSQVVTVTNGLFSTQIAPTGVDWQNVTPYMEVSIEGQLLLPRESINATVYATISNTVVDGAITTPKLDPGVQQYLVPAGSIMLFAGPCPASWTRFTALDGLFPIGSNQYGTTGGSATHTHSISTDGAHNHGGWTGQGDSPAPSDAGANFGTQNGWHLHSISTDGSHNHGGATGSASSLPPYLGMIFCQKN